MPDLPEATIRNDARNKPVEGDIPTYQQSPFVTVEPGEKVIFTFEPLNDRIFFLRWTEESFYANTFYEWYFDGEKVDEGSDVHQSLGDQNAHYLPPEKITSEVRIEITNVNSSAHNYAVRFGGWQRRKDRTLDDVNVGRSLR